MKWEVLLVGWVRGQVGGRVGEWGFGRGMNRGKGIGTYRGMGIYLK